MSDTPTAEPAAIILPWTVGIDTREQQPYEFKGLRANADRKHAPLIVLTERVTIPLGLGDYTISDLPKIGIERKSKDDLYGSIGQRRANFEERLQRMSTAPLWYRAIVIEAEFSEIVMDPPERSKMNPKALIRTILAWQMRWQNVAFWFLPNRAAAEAWTFRLMERFWAMHGHSADEVRAAEAAGDVLGCPDALDVLKQIDPNRQPMLLR